MPGSRFYLLLIWLSSRSHYASLSFWRRSESSLLFQCHSEPSFPVILSVAKNLRAGQAATLLHVIPAQAGIQRTPLTANCLSPQQCVFLPQRGSELQREGNAPSHKSSPFPWQGKGDRGIGFPPFQKWQDRQGKTARLPFVKGE